MRTKSPFTRWRKKNKLTQDDVARSLAIDRQYISLMERGGIVPLPKKFARFEQMTGGEVTHKMMIVWAYDITEEDIKKAANV